MQPAPSHDSANGPRANEARIFTRNPLTLASITERLRLRPLTGVKSRKALPGAGSGPLIQHFQGRHGSTKGSIVSELGCDTTVRRRSHRAEKSDDERVTAGLLRHELKGTRIDCGQIYEGLWINQINHLDFGTGVRRSEDCLQMVWKAAPYCSVPLCGPVTLELTSKMLARSLFWIPDY